MARKLQTDLRDTDLIFGKRGWVESAWAWSTIKAALLVSGFTTISGDPIHMISGESVHPINP